MLEQEREEIGIVRSQEQFLNNNGFLSTEGVCFVVRQCTSMSGVFPRSEAMHVHAWRFSP